MFRPLYKEENFTVYVHSLVTVRILNFQRDLGVVWFSHIGLILFLKLEYKIERIYSIYWYTTTTIILERYLWDNCVVLPLHQPSHLPNQFSLHMLAILTPTSHLNIYDSYMVQYICHIHSQISHIELLTIICTCPKSVKVTALSNPPFSPTSIFWILELISDFFVINLVISHSTKMREYTKNWNKCCNLWCWLYLLFMEL
jgi:hypothetical protein